VNIDAIVSIVQEEGLVDVFGGAGFPIHLTMKTSTMTRKTIGFVSLQIDLCLLPCIHLLSNALYRYVVGDILCI
jgi:Trk-type K+ transport system membrane component